MAKLVIILYFLSGDEQRITQYTTKAKCSTVLHTVGEVRKMFKADGIDAMCLFAEKDLGKLI